MRDVLSDLPLLALPALVLTALIVAALVLGGLLALGVRFLTTKLHAARRATAPAVEPYRDPRKGFACHRTSCGHMSWPHDETAEGLRCSRCGQINPDA